MRVLIAEDEIISREILRASLEDLQYSVESCATGAEAWDLLHTRSFDILISDWMMPDMDGLELCRKIRSHEAESYLYIILITIKFGREDRLLGFQAGADDYLSKPLDPDELEARLAVAQRILGIQAKLMEANSYLKNLASVDGLTSLYNHRAFQERLGDEFQRSLRYHKPLSVLMFDVDDFKSFNDTFGHPAGDDLLKQLSSVLQDVARKTDFVARYGGEEFALILPETEEQEATEAAERMRAAVASIPGKERCVSVSVGVSTMRPETSGHAILIEEADQALYASKTRGRNLVTHYATLDLAALPCSTEVEKTPLA